MPDSDDQDQAPTLRGVLKTAVDHLQGQHALVFGIGALVVLVLLATALKDSPDAKFVLVIYVVVIVVVFAAWLVHARVSQPANGTTSPSAQPAPKEPRAKFGRVVVGSVVFVVVATVVVFRAPSGSAPPLVEPTSSTSTTTTAVDTTRPTASLPETTSTTDPPPDSSTSTTVQAVVLEGEIELRGADVVLRHSSNVDGANDRHAYIDADDNPMTGFLRKEGAEYLIEDSRLFVYGCEDGDDFDCFEEIAGASDPNFAVSGRNLSTIEWSVGLALPGFEIGRTINVVFDDEVGGEVYDDAVSLSLADTASAAAACLDLFLAESSATRARLEVDEVQDQNPCGAASSHQFACVGSWVCDGVTGAGESVVVLGGDRALASGTARLPESYGLSPETLLLDVQVATCEPVPTVVRALENAGTYNDLVDPSGTPIDVVVDNDLSTGFESSFDDWQLVELDLGCPARLMAFARHMTKQGQSQRGAQGEGWSYSLDGETWTSVRTSQATGWEDYNAYSDAAWLGVTYNWSADLVLEESVVARFVRFNWDGDRDRLNELRVSWDTAQ